MDMLKHILRQHAIPVSGQKPILISRLKEFYRVKYVALNAFIY